MPITHMPAATLRDGWHVRYALRTTITRRPAPAALPTHYVTLMWKGKAMASEDYAQIQAIEDARTEGTPESELVWWPGYDLWHALYYER